MQVSAMFLLFPRRFSAPDQFEWNEEKEKKRKQSNIENMHFLGIFAEHKIQDSVCLWNISPMILISHVDGTDTNRSPLNHLSLSRSDLAFSVPRDAFHIIEFLTGTPNKSTTTFQII